MASPGGRKTELGELGRAGADGGEVAVNAMVVAAGTCLWIELVPRWMEARCC